MTSLRQVASLIAAVTVLQLALGLLSVHIPLAMRADQLSGVSIGIVGATYGAGFMTGAWFGPAALARVGHIRLFAASAAVIAATTLALYGASDTISWAVLRGLTGAGVSLLSVSVDSWMAAKIDRAERGGVIGVYQVVTKIGLAAGPFLVFMAPQGDEAAPYMIAGALGALALVPVSLTTQAQPPTPHARPLSLPDQYRTAPAAVIAAFAAGIINGGVLLLAPVYAAAAFGADKAGAFQSAAWIGSFLLQWPAGRLSDRIDRRLVILGLAAIGAAAALTLAVFGASAPFWLAAALFALWGAGGLSYYGVATAHMADRAEPHLMAQAASGLLFVWAFGSILGPIAIGALSDVLGPSAVFWFGGVGLLALTLTMLVRAGVREKTDAGQKEAFAPPPQTSVMAAEIVYGGEDEPSLPFWKEGNGKSARTD